MWFRYTLGSLLLLGRPSEVDGCTTAAECQCPWVFVGGTFSLFGQCADTSNGNQVDHPNECRIGQHDQCGCNASGQCELLCMDFESMAATEIVEDLLRDPNGFMEVRSVTSSSHACFQHFNRGHVMGYHAATNEPLVPEEGLIMSTGKPHSFCWNDNTRTSHEWLVAGDVDIDTITGFWSMDACAIEFEFQCHTEFPAVSLRYVFGSEEYIEYVESNVFSDALAFLLNGDNTALVPNTTDAVSVHSIHGGTGDDDGSNAAYYVDNPRVTGQYEIIEADGFTTTLTARGTPNDGWNTMRIVIADINDYSVDSYVLIEAGSLTCVDPAASARPSALPSSIPSTQSSTMPSSIRSTQPSSVLSLQPSTMPTSIPSVQPSTGPTSIPSTQPSTMPSSIASSVSPSKLSSGSPSVASSESPSKVQSGFPSLASSDSPSMLSSGSPSVVSSEPPSKLSSGSPSVASSESPSKVQSGFPSLASSDSPSMLSSGSPSVVLSEPPSKLSSGSPSVASSESPSKVQSGFPSLASSDSPSMLSSGSPSVVSSESPSKLSSGSPSVALSESPSKVHTSPSWPTMSSSLTPSAIRKNFCKTHGDCGGMKKCTKDPQRCKCRNMKCRKLGKDCKTRGRGLGLWRCPDMQDCIAKLNSESEPKMWGKCMAAA